MAHSKFLYKFLIAHGQHAQQCITTKLELKTIVHNQLLTNYANFLLRNLARQYGLYEGGCIGVSQTLDFSLGPKTVHIKCVKRSLPKCDFPRLG